MGKKHKKDDWMIQDMMANSRYLDAGRALEKFNQVEYALADIVVWAKEYNVPISKSMLKETDDILERVYELRELTLKKLLEEKR